MENPAQEHSRGEEGGTPFSEIRHWPHQIKPSNAWTSRSFDDTMVNYFKGIGQMTNADLSIVFAMMAMLIPGTAAASHVCDIELDTPRKITTGIDYQKIEIECKSDDMGSPSTMANAHLVLIDLNTDNLSVHTSLPTTPAVPKAAEVGQLFGVTLTTSVFSSQAQASAEAPPQIAINSNLFTNCCTDSNDPTQVTLLRGLEIENSVTNTPALANLDCTIPHATFASSLLISSKNKASIWTATSNDRTPPADTVTAVTGSHQIVSKFNNTAPSCKTECQGWLGLNARTAVGAKNNGATLMMIVINGKDGGKEGATLYQLADVMTQLGAVDAINLDGGGSSTMAQRDIGPNGPYWVLSALNDHSGGNCTVKSSDPEGGCERYVGNVLYVTAP